MPTNYVIEFAGMPKSGKTTVCDTVSHYLKRTGVCVDPFHGGGRFAPISKTYLADLNTYLAAEIVSGLVAWSRRTSPTDRVLMMDRGLADRYIFTELLRRQGKLSAADAACVTRLLLMPSLVDRVGMVFIFVTSPSLSLEHEYAGKLIEAPGRVMNADWLTQNRTACVDAAHELCKTFRTVQLVDTALHEGDPRAVAADIASSIEQHLGRREQ